MEQVKFMFIFSVAYLLTWNSLRKSVRAPLFKLLYWACVSVIVTTICIYIYRLKGNDFQHTIKTQQYESKKIVCYYNSWSYYRPGNGKFLVEQIDPTLCTHLIYTFAKVEDDGFTISSLDQYLEEDYGLQNLKRFNNLKNKSESLKTLIAVGGYVDGSLKFSKMSAWKWRRRKFVKNIVQFVLKYGFDGVDIDWEFPGQRGGTPGDKQNFVRLLKGLRQELNKYGLLLSVAVSAIKSTIDVSYDIPALVSYVDFINLMSYDYSDSRGWTTSFNSPLHTSTIATDNRLFLNVEFSVNYWIELGAPSRKLVLGIPFYGRTFTLKDPLVNGIGAPTSGPGRAGPFLNETGTLAFNEELSYKICTYKVNSKLDLLKIYKDPYKISYERIINLLFYLQPNFFPSTRYFYLIYISYFKICLNFQTESWLIRQNLFASTPYATRDNQWISYEDMDSITTKVNFLLENNLGGVMVWSIDTDDFTGTCYGQNFPLLKVINSVINSKAEYVTVLPEEKWSSSPSNENISRHEVTCTKEGFFVSPKDCSKFYRCTLLQTGKFLMSSFDCPPQTIFDSQYNVCTWKKNVNNTNCSQ
ncbi:chitinase-3-like protein 1 [Tachypleus tridentatus]|uniref:chitinase-3-like protein 1 n=1 Tax=Tachypleus tridentatus TaxID=6853 RepID=UPI003FD2142E